MDSSIYLVDVKAFEINLVPLKAKTMVGWTNSAHWMVYSMEVMKGNERDC